MASGSPSSLQSLPALLLPTAPTRDTSGHLLLTQDPGPLPTSHWGSPHWWATPVSRLQIIQPPLLEPRMGRQGLALGGDLG